MLNLTHIKKLPPREVLTFYLGRLHMLSRIQIYEAMRLHGKGETDDIYREKFVALAISRRLILQSKDYPDFLSIAAAYSVPNRMVERAFWVALEYMKCNVAIDVLGANEYNGIDFIHIPTHSMVRIIPIANGNMTTYLRAAREPHDDTSYVFLLDSKSQASGLKAITPKDTMCLASNMQQRRLWDVEFIEFPAVKEA